MSNIKKGTWKTPFDADEKLPNKSEGLLTSCVQIKKEENVMFCMRNTIMAMKWT